MTIFLPLVVCSLCTLRGSNYIFICGWYVFSQPNGLICTYVFPNKCIIQRSIFTCRSERQRLLTKYLLIINVSEKNGTYCAENGSITQLDFFGPIRNSWVIFHEKRSHHLFLKLQLNLVKFRQENKKLLHNFRTVFCSR